VLESSSYIETYKKIRHMTKLKLTQVAEVSMIDQFMAVMTFLESMGIETSELTSMDVASIRYDLLKSIDAL
jgi:Asp-tRNA(Asn)/Glu-tRNA(Gln) amidotransferase C subunit